jgi:hypothetical protein
MMTESIAGRRGKDQVKTGLSRSRFLPEFSVYKHIIIIRPQHHKSDAITMTKYKLFRLVGLPKLDEDALT